MDIIIILLVLGIGVWVYLYRKNQEEKRREAERLANRKNCVLCGRIHYNKGNRCTPCCIELLKKQKGIK